MLPSAAPDPSGALPRLPPPAPVVLQLQHAQEHTINLGNVATALHAQADVQVAEALAPDDEDGLEGLVPQDLGLHQLQRSACRHRASRPPLVPRSGEHACPTPSFLSSERKIKCCIRRGSAARQAGSCPHCSWAALQTVQSCHPGKDEQKSFILHGSCSRPPRRPPALQGPLLAIELDQAGAGLAVGNCHRSLLRVGKGQGQ